MNSELAINALVLGVGGNVSQGIIKALRQIDGLKIRIVGACVSEESVGLYMCDVAYISPYAVDSHFCDWLVKLCNKEKIDIVFTGVEENINRILRDKSHIENRTKAKFIFPNNVTWEVGADKYYTCKWLENNNCNFPKYALLSDSVEVEQLVQQNVFPLIVKPRDGKGSHGIKIISSKIDLENYIASLPDDKTKYVLEECVGNKDSEYTVGCYCDKNGELVGLITLHRYLSNGTTSICEVVKNEEIEIEVRKIVSKSKPVGPFNIQLRIADDGRPVCFEWNVRFSGTTAIRNRFGFRDIELAIREYVLNEVPDSRYLDYKSGVAVRYDEEMYFDKLASISEL